MIEPTKRVGMFKRAFLKRGSNFPLVKVNPQNDIALLPTDDLRTMASSLSTRNDEWKVANWLENHVCGNKELFETFHELVETDSNAIPLDQGNLVLARARGTIKIKVWMCNSWSEITLREVLYVPGSGNFVSVSAFSEKGFTLDDSRRYFRHPHNTAFNIAINKKDETFLLKSRPVQCDIQVEKLGTLYKPAEIVLLWHLRLGHLDIESIKLLLQSDMIHIDSTQNVICKWCSKNSSPIYNNQELVEPNQIILGDIIVISAKKQKSVSLNGNKFLILLEEKSTKYCWGLTLKVAEDIMTHFMDFVKNFELVHHTKIKCFDTSNITHQKIQEKIARVCSKLGIKVISPQYDPLSNWELNPSLKKIWQNVSNNMLACDLPEFLWDELLDSSLLLHNIIPTNNISPYEQMFGTKPSLSNLRITGSPVRPSQVEGYNMDWVLIGSNTKGIYACFNKKTKKVVYTRSATVFEEQILIQNWVSNTLNKELEPSAPLIETTTTQNMLNEFLRQRSEIVETFKQMEIAGFSNLDGLRKILKPYEQVLQLFTDECQNAYPYLKTENYPRSRTLDQYNCSIKREFEPLETDNDGLCHYKAVSTVLFGSQDHHLQIRLLVTWHLLENWEIIQPNCLQLFNRGIQDIVKELVCLSMWATENITYILTEVLARPIYVVNINDTLLIHPIFYNSDPNSEKKPPMYILLHHLHYEPLAPKKIDKVSVITRSISANFYLHISHKYAFNDNLEIDRNILYREFEYATRIVSTKANSSTKQIYPTDILVKSRDGKVEGTSSALVTSSCFNCKKSNERLKTLFANEALLREQLRKKISADIHAQNLPIIHCESCTKLATTTKQLEFEKNQIKLQMNTRGDQLIHKIRELEAVIQNLNGRLGNLTEGHELLYNTLQKRNQEKDHLQLQLALIAKNLNENQRIPSSSTKVVKIHAKNKLYPSLSNLSDGSNGSTDSSTSTSSSCSSSSDESSSSNNSSGHRSIRNIATPHESQQINSLMDLIENIDENQDPEDLNSGWQNIVNGLVENSIKKYEQPPASEVDQFRTSANDLVSSGAESQIDPVQKPNGRRDTVNGIVENAIKDLERPPAPNYQLNILESDLALSDSEPLNNGPTTSPENERIHSAAVGVNEITKHYVNKMPNVNLSEDEYSQPEIPQSLNKINKLADQINQLRQDLLLSSQSTEEDFNTSEPDGQTETNRTDFQVITSESETEVDSLSGISEEEIIKSTSTLCKYLGVELPDSIVKMKEKRNPKVQPEKKTTHTIKFKIGGKEFLAKYDFPYELPEKTPSQTGATKKILKKKCQRSGERNTKTSSDKTSGADCINSLASSCQANNLKKGKKIKCEQNTATKNTQRDTSGPKTDPEMKFRISIKSNESKFPRNLNHGKRNNSKPMSKNSDINNIAEDEEEKFPCPNCSKTYKNSSSLKRHMESHEEVRYPCKLCAKTFLRYEYFVKHSKRFHSGDRTRKCRFCSHTLTKSEAAMRTHERAKHLKEYLLLEKQVEIDSSNENSVNSEYSDSESD